jgi:hypothetical protein
MAYKNSYQNNKSRIDSKMGYRKEAILLLNTKLTNRTIGTNSSRSITLAVLLILIPLLATGCGNSIEPDTDLSSLENTIKSYWAVKQYEMKERMARQADSIILDLYDERLRQIEQTRLDERMKRWKDPLPHTIESVSFESPARAIIYTSEVLTHSGDSTRTRHKYILTKVDEDWYIENVFSECGTCRGTGKEDDYSAGTQPDGKIKQKVCDRCKGVGFTSDIYR